MSQFRKMGSVRGNLREILMTTIATSISIALTFGTSMCLQHRQKVKDGRQMAMMVIHDMDENIEVMKSVAKQEKRNYAVARYVLDHLDQIESISEDTLSQVWFYLFEGREVVPDESNERIFNSSMETWRVIDNPTFINLVQTFYSMRRHYFDLFKKDINFIRPFSEERKREIQIEAADNNYNVISNTDLLKKVLSDDRVEYYVEWSTVRSDFYEQIASEWQCNSDQAKFLIGITDDELEEFVALKNQHGMPVGDKELFGEWSATSTKGDNTETITFRQDHTFTHQTTTHLNSPIWTGDALRHHYFTGRWKLEGDSLIREYDVGHSYGFDFSQIKYSEEMKDTVENLIAKTLKDVERINEKAKNQQLFGRRANMATIDKSGNKIELARTTTDEAGKETTETSYMTRAKTN